ncbi:PhnD/SsuA/transferrin family substrate-binding protein [Candidatus Albibeggiatoa sp. nov. NOAA]|uniref:phosphate/phosphite/phosphonate ABC transporter substrate-binding protein n=1 Tax=Candidatus Albibeggiatoa sp. nov. NOAA TaxID=3162724 RepID=UPI0033006AB2|nr:phosphate/phosphite/phosphonate ABC transporter substrate-binding protein [Thiotrichaceae bacterium]
MISIKWLWGFSLVTLLVACGQESAEQQYKPEFSSETTTQKEEYIFGVHPLHNPKQLQVVYAPVADYLSQHFDNIQFRLEASRNYAAYEEKLYAGKFHFALPNPYQTITAEDNGYTIFGKMGDDENFRGIFITRKDSSLQNPIDVKGQSVSYPAPTALAATMLPQYFLHTNGINVNQDIENLYVGSQESSIMNAYLGKVAAAATWPLPWKIFLKEKPDFAAELEVKWETPTLPNNGLVVRADIPQEVVQKVSALLFTLHENKAGQEILARMPLSKFEAADHQTFQVVRDFIQTFTEEIRPPKNE